MENRLIEEAKRWFRQALSDFNFLEQAKYVKKYDVVCFLAQQTAEKALKSYLYFKGEEIIFTHSIFKLCEISAQYDKDFLQLKNKVKNLDHFYVEARYPNAIEDTIPAEFFNEEDANEAIKMAKETLDFVRAKINL